MVPYAVPKPADKIIERVAGVGHISAAKSTERLMKPRRKGIVVYAHHLMDEEERVADQSGHVTHPGCMPCWILRPKSLFL